MIKHSFNRSFLSLILFVLFIFSGSSASAQCVDSTLCYSSEPFPSINFGISERFQSQANTTVFQDPLIIDTDGDCIPEIIMSGTTGYTSTPRKTSGITIASSLNGTTISSFPTCFYSWTNALAYVAGDINNDGIPELIVAAINHSSNPLNQRGRLICYSMSGNILWISNQQFGLNTLNHYDATPALADFNADGTPEVYAHNQVFNAQTGELLLDGGSNGLGVNTYSPGIYESSICIVGDFDNNSNDLELAAGYTVYDITINNINGTSGNTSVPHNILVDGIYRDGFTSMADINLDGKLDIVVSSPGTETSSRLYAYYLNAALNPVLIAQTAMPRATSVLGSDFSGPPYIGDLDGNGLPTICVTRNYLMIAYTYNGSTNFQQKWILNTVDQSGCTGITSFDFDQNGIQEIVFRDENNLQILNGNGTSATILSSINCTSPTVNDMAIVADIDHSGQARICVTCGNGNTAKVVVYESNSATGWAPARGIWNQYAYHVSNIEDNGSVPAQQQNNAANALSNNFYIQSTLLDNNGNYLIPAADASITVDCITNNLATGNLEITYTLSNDALSSKPILPGCSIYIYNSGPLSGVAAIYSGTVNATIPPGQSYTGTITVSAALFNNPTITLLANANGTLINGSYNSTHFDQTECDYSNNIGNGPILSMTAGTDLSLCSLQPVIMDASLYLPFTGTWQVLSGAGTFSDIHDYNAEFTPSGTQNITLQWTMNQGSCALAIDQVQLIFQSTPLQVIPDTLICIGDSIQTGYSDPSYTYEWAFHNWISDIHVGMPYFSPTSTSYATVTASNTVSGCVVTDSILIEVAELPQFTIPADDTLCFGQSITLTGWGSTGIMLTWNNGQSNPYTLSPSTGIHQYILEAVSPQGCNSSDTVTIIVYPSPTAAFSYSPEIILEDEELVTTVNHSENASNYTWRVNNNLLSEETNLAFTSDQSQTSYTIQLIAFNEFGCSDTVSRKINRFVDNLVFIPNAFTPDGNNTNNTFMPVFFKPEEVQEYQLEIFNRWGELIFTSESAVEYWDGTYKGKMVPDGIYTWKLHLYDNTSGKDVDFIGHVTLLR
jgi:gliding motility-associated-like protein